MNDVSTYVLQTLRFQGINLVPEFDERIWVKSILGEIITCLGDTFKRAGAHRQAVWETGWVGEGIENGIPVYFGKYPVIRVNQKFVGGADILNQAEYASFCAVQNYVYKKFLPETDVIYEVGAGPGHNLPLLQYAMPRATVYGLDWAQSAVLQIRKLGFPAHQFNMFDPVGNLFVQDSVVVTVAAMEQLGTNFQAFVEFLWEQRPQRVIHIEPINELLDPTHLLDLLSILYTTARGYLTGYLPFLREWEKLGRIKILAAKRSYIGSLMLDGYSIVVWEPV